MKLTEEEVLLIENDINLATIEDHIDEQLLGNMPERILTTEKEYEEYRKEVTSAWWACMKETMEPGLKPLTEEQLICFGRSVAYLLGYDKKDREHWDRWTTNEGTKTDLGLGRTILRLLEDVKG
jgi:hypothetical protein